MIICCLDAGALVRLAVNRPHVRATRLEAGRASERVSEFGRRVYPPPFFVPLIKISFYSVLFSLE